ncbi:hypothetical protein AVEN_250910-1 [Araneus ventricosus]|uniref:Uncharacterized protein n=1 Tax=Araneus ventricosus TaxID=182803 RepID=A0A4Y2ILS3_ARAVE|nr:hypothetical protein AVEN_250910-1 [Araneus ventricosus]
MGKKCQLQRRRERVKSSCPALPWRPDPLKNDRCNSTDTGVGVLTAITGHSPSPPDRAKRAVPERCAGSTTPCSTSKIQPKNPNQLPCCSSWILFFVPLGYCSLCRYFIIEEGNPYQDPPNAIELLCIIAVDHTKTFVLCSR